MTEQWQIFSVVAASAALGALLTSDLRRVVLICVGLITAFEITLFFM
jgi:hypothetical protein